MVLIIRSKVASFYIEMAVFVLAVGVFTKIPLNQEIMQTSMFALFLIACFLSWKLHLPLKNLGISKPSKVEVVGYTIITFCFIIGILIMKSLSPEGVFPGFSRNRDAFKYVIPFYILVGTLLQEFVFRGYLFARTRGIFSGWRVVSINILLFSIFHLPYLVQLRSGLMYLSIVAGTVWSLVYYKYPNLFLVWASHAVAGGLTLVLLQRF